MRLSANQSSRSSSVTLLAACGLPARSRRVLFSAGEGHCPGTSDWSRQLIFEFILQIRFHSNVSLIAHKLSCLPIKGIFFSSPSFFSMKSKCCSAYNGKRPIVGICCFFFFSSLTVFFPCRWSLSSSPPSASPPSSYFSIELHQLFSVAPVLATACVFTPDVEVCCFSNRLFSFSLLPNPILPLLYVVRPSLPPSLSPMSILNH